VAGSPETNYVRTPDGIHLAYQLAGKGPIDLVSVLVAESSVEAEWQLPPLGRLLTRLASIARVIRFDFRGTGLSDRMGANEDRKSTRLNSSH